MAKEGLDFFPLNCQLDEKIELIEAQYGLKGFAVVVKLLQRIYGEHGYYCEWNDDIAFLFARQNGLSNGEAPNNLICDIVSASIRRGIFDKGLFDKYGILTSKGIQKRYLEATSRRTEVTLKKEYLLLSADNFKGNVNILSENVCKNQKNADSFSQSKVKESKVNNKYSPAFEKAWAVYPRKKEKSAAFKAFNARAKEGYSESDLILAAERYASDCKTLNTEERYIKHGSTFWGCNTPFADYLTEDYKPVSKSADKKAGTKFNNFNQRDYDFAELERQLINQ